VNNVIIDAHQDIAYAAWSMGRDFRQSAHETRRRESANGQQTENICTVGLPDMLSGGVRMVFGSLFVEPMRSTSGRPGPYAYSTAQEAHDQALIQLDYYNQLGAAAAIRLIKTRTDLHALASKTAGQPLGLMVVIEGGDAILSPADVEAWRERGVRQVGLAWANGSRYCGGNRETGPLTAGGKDILRAMERAGLILDVSHMAEESFWQALDIFHGPIVASHSNCRALLNGGRQLSEVMYRGLMERHLSDDMIRAIVQHDGVIGAVLYNRFLDADWSLEKGKSAVPLSVAVRHIDHICQIAGDDRHVGLGSDLDGGFGCEATPAEIDTVADLRLLTPLLAASGHAPDSVARIMGGNWLSVLERALPQ
jgi:membrane dipeptidase